MRNLIVSSTVLFTLLSTPAYAVYWAGHEDITEEGKKSRLNDRGEDTRQKSEQGDSQREKQVDSAEAQAPETSETWIQVLGQILGL